MSDRLDAAALAQLFTNARTHNAWQARDVPDALLRELVETLRWGPTSANCQPARIVFVKSQAAKARLKPLLGPNNVEKTMAAPVTAIVGMDMAFYEHLPRMFPHNPSARSWFEGKPDHIAATALRNSSLQGAYLILAARALGLDAGPMSGFDNAGIDKEFFAGTTVRSNLLCNLGYGDPAGLHVRGPRFGFDEMASIV